MLVLPVDVICELIFPHLSICDLQAFDTAFTNKYLRPQLRQVWKSYQYNSVNEISSDDLCWLHSIDAEVIEVTLAGKCSHIEVLTHFSTLRRLDCEMSKLDVGLRSVAVACPFLETISLKSGGGYADVGIQALCDYCPHIKHVTFAFCNFLTDTSLISIANAYPHLQSLHVSSTDITNDGLMYLADKCHELRSVSVWSDHNTRRGLTALWAANPNLMEVNVCFNYFISDDDIIRLAQCCPLLQKLDLYCCETITDAAVIAVAEHCPQLRSLNICECYNVSDASLVAIGQHCHELKSINISCLRKITDVGIAALAAGCPLLQEFSAEYCDVTDAGVVALARGCRDLRKIGLNQCKSIGNAAVSAIAENCPLMSE